MRFPVLHPPETLRLMLAATLVGIWIAKLLPENPTDILLLGLLGTGALWGIFRNTWTLAGGIFVLALGWGFLQPQWATTADHLPARYGENVVLQGMVASFVDAREKTHRATLAVSHINGKPTQGSLLLVTPTEGSKYEYGDKLEVRGKLLRPTKFEDFDYYAYLERSDIRTLLRNPNTMTILSSGHGNPLLTVANQVRQWFIASLQTALPPPHNSVATGILIGTRHTLPNFLQQDFKASGLQHLLVVSGFNVTIVVFFITLMLKRFGRWITFVGAIASIIFFVALVGAEAPILRAGIMGGAVGMAAVLGRFGDGRNILLLAGAIMAVLSPKMIQGDPGFWLSFSATGGLVLGVPLAWKILKWIPNVFQLRMLLAATVAAQVAVLPLLGLFFGQFPLAGLGANLLAEPLIPWGMGFAFITGLAEPLPLLLQKIISIPAYGILELLLHIARLFAQIPQIPLSRTVSLILCAILAGAFAYGFSSRKYAKKILNPFEGELDFSTPKK